MPKIEIIAEIGVNWGGDLDLAKKLVRVAKDAGVNTAKFQLYDPRKLFPDGKVVTQGKNWFRDILWMKDFGEKELSELKDYCSKVELEFLCSAFDLERLGWLEEFGVKRHKIATRMNRSFGYIQAVIDTNKEIFLSCDSSWPVPEPPFYVPYRTKFLYCIPEYPTPLNHLLLPHTFKHPEGTISGWDGFSDHTEGLEAAMVAISRGATIIERHFCLERDGSNPDMVCSSMPEEMRRLVDFARKVEEIP